MVIMKIIWPVRHEYQGLKQAIKKVIAKLCLATAITLFSNTVLAHGIVHEQIDQLSVQIKQNPTNVPLRLKRGQLHTIDQNWLQAQVDFKAVRAFNAKHSTVDLLEAKMWFAAHQPNPAYRLINRYLKNYPATPAALDLRAKLNLLLGHSQAAMNDYASVIKYSDTVSPDMFLQWAKAQASIIPINQQQVHSIIQMGLNRLGLLVVLLQYAIDFDRQHQSYLSALHWLEQLPLKLRNQPHWRVQKAQLLESLHKPLEAYSQYDLALTSLNKKKSSGHLNRAEQKLLETIQQSSYNHPM